MTRSFNTTGPCIPGEHYMLPPERRLGRVQQLIDQHKYFTMHAGRQTGKTTSLMWLKRHLNASGRWRALWVDLETAREQPDLAAALPIVLENIDRTLRLQHPNLARPEAAEIEAVLGEPANALLEYLARLCALDERPVVLLLDEADGLVGPAMVSVLTQLRAGYIARSEAPFPASVALVGQRQVRDYVLSADDRRALSWLGTTSPFNVTAEATTLSPFTEAEVHELLAQHTMDTRQRFEPAAMHRIWELALGHPWLTNALAAQITDLDVRDRSVAITVDHVDAAKETLILERRSHIDSLIARLREPRVRRILEPMLAGTRLPADLLDDDLSYTLGLGLVRVERGELQIANPIYREVIPRALTWSQQISLHQPTEWYVRPDGTLDMIKLMAAWQAFWREDGHLAADGFNYREAGPHLMVMAFLQRIVNGGGRVEREYGLGRGALDLMIFWKTERHAIEVKLRRDTETEAKALDQMAGYLERAGLDDGWLLLFDLRKETSWVDKLFVREVEHAAKKIRIVGC
ncbi:MAG: ATP-binding protein [Deltaproteobacteria bacterium]|nr:MAG: ATP-binding protein [Deltaproteobacteria bacterium]TMQ21950.1 MAG: ATP-binding protein [Deltaproteobacteria bacterium]